MGDDGKLYCKKDFVAAFAPKCGGCKLAIEGGWGSVALPLGCLSHMCSPKQMPCTEMLILLRTFERCCHIPSRVLVGGCWLVGAGDAVAALEQQWHPECFVCTQCRGPLESFRSHEGSPYCEVGCMHARAVALHNGLGAAP